MIYLIGGVMRAGKSTLAQLLCASFGMGWVSTDALRKVLSLTDPTFRYVASAEPGVLIRQADEFYPVLEAFARSMNIVAESYAIEGIAFFPRHADRLRSIGSIRACFLGWSKVDLATLEAHPGRNDWLTGMSDEFRSELPGRLLEMSEIVRHECEEHGFRYMDMCGDFNVNLSRARGFLLGESGAAVVILSGNGEILLIKENYGHRRWSLPGGTVELGESSEEAAIREALEETGLHVRLGEQLGTYTIDLEIPFPVSVYLATTDGAPLVPSTGEIAEARWFGIDSVPEPTSNVLPAVLDDVRNGARGVERQVPNRYG